MEPAPLYTDVTVPLSDGAAYWLRATDGIRVRVGVWREGMRGTVLMFPGRTEYIEKYVHVAAAMRPHGLATLIVDWRGQGLSDRLLPDRATGHVGKFQDYQQDVVAALAAANRLGLPEPFFLIAHSMGACIGLRSLMRGLQVKAAAFSGPMWGIRLNPVARPSAIVIGRLARAAGQAHRYAPTTGPTSYVTVASFEGNMLTTDREMFEMMKRQLAAHPDLALGGPSLHWLTEAMAETRVLRALPSPKVPCVTALGAAERVVNMDAVRDRMARWPNGRLDLYEGAEHEIIVERPEHLNRFFAGAVELFEAHRNDR